MKLVFPFGYSSQSTEVLSEPVNLLGGKGAKLVTMTDLGLNVPSGVIISTEACRLFMDIAEDKALRLEFCKSLVHKHVLPELKTLLAESELLPLFSVRSGARVSMAGMMDTILNVGITPETFQLLKAETGNRVAYDCRRRLVTMYADVVHGADLSYFNQSLEEVKQARNYTSDSQVSPKEWDGLLRDLEPQLEANGYLVPDTLEEQLINAVYAVFNSWNNPRAKAYRRIHGIPDTWGTAVVIQSMVFGNMGNDSGSGVMFTANPATGTEEIVGEYLQNAQGEDVVAGVRTPLLLDHARSCGILPEGAYETLQSIANDLEHHFNDIQDIEFTIQKGEVFVLQTRDAKRSPLAAVNYATDMLTKGHWNHDDVRKRLTPRQVATSLEVRLDGDYVPFATGIAAGGTIISGVPVTSAEEAHAVLSSERKAILVAKETTPDDIEAIHLCAGILTTTGGLTSHAAVVARGMGKTCVVGCTDLDVERILKRSAISMCGSTGNVYLESVKTTAVNTTPIIKLADALGLDYTDGLNIDSDKVAYLNIRTSNPNDLINLVGDMLTTYENVVLCYEQHASDSLSLILGDRLPSDLVDCVKLVKKHYPECLGNEILVICPSNYTEALEEAVTAKCTVAVPKTVADLLTRPYAVINDTTLVSVFGSNEAAAVVVACLEEAGQTLAQDLRAPCDPVDQVCKFLMES